MIDRHTDQIQDSDTLGSCWRQIESVSLTAHPPLRKPAIWIRPEDVHRQEAGNDGGQCPRGEAVVEIQTWMDRAASADQMRHFGVS